MVEVLATIKKTLGITPTDTSFDVDITMYINTTLFILSQLITIDEMITQVIDENTTWDELIGDNADLEVVKTYINFKVKNMFDPPTNSAAAEANKRIIDELEWRIVNLKTNKEVLPIV